MAQNNLSKNLSLLRRVSGHYETLLQSLGIFPLEPVSFKTDQQNPHRRSRQDGHKMPMKM